MAKKKSRRFSIAQSVPNAAVDALPVAEHKVAHSITLDRYGKRFGELAKARDWDGIVKWGRMSVVEFPEHERDRANEMLISVLVFGLTEGLTRVRHGFEDSRDEEIRKLLLWLRDQLPNFHAEPEFDLYLASRNFGIEDTADAFQYMATVCQAHADVRYLAPLRNFGLSLLGWKKNGANWLKDKEKALIESCGDISETLRAAYAKAAMVDTPHPDRDWIQVVRLEWEMRFAPVQDPMRLAERIRALPAASGQQLSEYMNEVDQPERLITPDGWAFLYELAKTRLEGFSTLLGRYAGAFGEELCRGLWLLLSAMSHFDALEAERQFVCGVNLLAASAQTPEHWLGSTLLLRGEGGLYEMDFSRFNLHVPLSLIELLTKFSEELTPDSPYHAPLDALQRLLPNAIEHVPIEDEEEAGLDMPGLQWLCERSFPFLLVASQYIQGYEDRVCLQLEAILHVGENGHDLPEWYKGETALPKGVVDADKATLLLQRLESCAGISCELPKHAHSLLMALLSQIVQAVLQLGPEVQMRTLRVARRYADDLVEGECSFSLAVLEHLVGERHSALRYYLIHMEATENLSEALLKNLGVLWPKVSSLEEANKMVATLEEAQQHTQHPKTLATLLRSALSRREALDKASQYEKTAVNRWPSVTAPARKLLGVLATISSFSNFTELGQYAGMEPEWAKRHYNKLLELGMITDEGAAFEINPYIRPLIEQESKHAVVGRIVRTQGTSAVKQVFNSQREFSIYQVLVQLCPNHLVFPNCSLQSIMSYDRMKEMVEEDDFGYYLRASVDIVVVSSTTHLPMLAIEVDSIWHDTERQQKNDEKKDRLFGAAGIPFLRLRPLGAPSEDTIRVQVAEHVDELVRSLREDMPGYDQAKKLLEDLSLEQTRLPRAG